MRSMHRRRSLALVPVLLAASAALGAPKVVGYIKLEGALAERHKSASVLMAAAAEPTLREVLESLRDAASPSSDVSGVVLRLSEVELNASQVEELGAAIGDLRHAGKQVQVFTEEYGPTELLLGSYADQVIMQQGGAVSLPGMYAEEMFLADALKKLGVQPDFVQIGDYKGASEMLANSRPSPQWDQNINQLLDSRYEQMVARLMEGRKLTREQVENAMTLCFMADGDTAVKAGLIDRTLDRPDLDTYLESIYGDNFTWDDRLTPEDEAGPDLAHMGFFEVFSEVMKAIEGQDREPTRDTIALLHIDGQIVDGESGGGGILGGGGSVGSLTIRKALQKIEEDDHIKGVIVRISSPGGSAIASESIWLGLRRVAEKKPVWASVGSMAASGGYYIAVGSDKIYVNRSSIVGSIGVVGGKLALGGLYEKLGINVVPRSRGPMASIMGGLAPWTADQKDLIRRKMVETYDLFVSRVTAGRKGIEIDKTAEGRLFTGDKAIDLHMADKLGGVEVAVADMAASLGLREGGYDLLDFPKPRSFEEVLKDMLPMASAPGATRDAALALAGLKELVGAGAWDQVRASLAALLELRREPVLVVSPRALIFR